MGPPHPSTTRPTRLSCSSTATHSGSSDSRRNLHRKENQFIYRHGTKLHAYDRDKAPYPSSFDRDVVELQCLDEALTLAAKGTSSFVEFDGTYPKRCLDIGTGLGLWVIDSAKQWPEATFVGLDMVNIQVPLRILEPGIADRVEWVHTNILRNKLPFEDEEFDHVHIKFVALGIPENKWHALYEEIRRVMKPGATIEHIEEDAIFPTLPRWYTDPLRAHSRALSTAAPGNAEARLSYHQKSEMSHLEHEHELLEVLFDDVWSNRFINPTPTSILPSYFSSFFDRVLSPPVVHWLTPPFPPFAPLAAPHDLSIPLRPNGSFHHPINSDNGHQQSIPHDNGSTLLTPHKDVPTSNSLSPSPSSTLQAGSNGDGKGGLSPSPSVASFHNQASETQPLTRRDSEAASLLSETSHVGSHSSGSGSSRSGKRPSVMLLASPEEGTSIGGNSAIKIIPIERVQSQDEQTLFMHLYSAITLVLSTKEAMWDELLARVLAKDEDLKKYGWRDDDYDEQASRQRFERAVDQYQSDMRGRIALWNCAVQNGWELPSRDPPTRAEVFEEMHLRHEILEAQRTHDTGEPEPSCRRVRILIGSKES